MIVSCCLTNLASGRALQLGHVSSLKAELVAMVIYRGYFIVRRGPENLEASAIMALFETQLRRVGNTASVKARPRYVE